jgi:hypothetical protein
LESPPTIVRHLIGGENYVKESDVNYEPQSYAF